MAEEKTRIHTRISPDTKRKMETAMPNANCQSQNEFVEEAIRFYSDYIITQEVTNFLAPMLVSALRATIQGSENRIARLMFKETVELSMMMNVLAAVLGISRAGAYELVRSDGFPTLRIGSRIVVPKEKFIE